MAGGRPASGIVVGVEEGFVVADQEWFDLVSATLSAPPMAAWSIVAVDALGGRILGATPGAEALVGGPLPADVGALVATGVVLQRDVERYVAHLERGRVERPADGVQETAFFWADDLHLRLPTGDRVLDTTVLHHRRPRWHRELVLITLYEREPSSAAASRDRVGNRGTGPTEMWALHDPHGRSIALDPAWQAIYPDPDSLIGTLAAVLVHPDDMTDSLPIATEVYAGRADRVEYRIRLRAPDDRWIPVAVEARRLLGPQPLVLSVSRLIDEERVDLPPGTLSAREQEIVDALFDGLRVAQLAARDGVSVNTVRNQLKSIYRKLDVTGQADLLSRYRRP